MTTEDFISELFYRVDEAMKEFPKHPLANLWPSEIVTVGILFALKGRGNRAFYRWLSRDWHPLFPALPERTRLFRLLATHRTWSEAFLALPLVRHGHDDGHVSLPPHHPPHITPHQVTFIFHQDYPLSPDDVRPVRRQFFLISSRRVRTCASSRLGFPFSLR
jgi:hypothetical protein